MSGDILLEDKIASELSDVVICFECGCLIEGEVFDGDLCIDCA